MKYIKRKFKLLPKIQRKEYVNVLLKLLNVKYEEMQEYIYNKEKYKYLSWENVIQLHNDGFEIGAHTHTHPTLSMLAHNHIREELQIPFEILKQKLQMSSVSLAYPHGTTAHIGEFAPKIAKEIGYDFALSTIAKSVEDSENIFMINRVTFEEFINKTKDN